MANSSQIFVLFGLAIGIAAVVLGIVALATSEWLIIRVVVEIPTGNFVKQTPKNYSVFGIGSSKIPPGAKFDVVKGLEIAGVATILVGTLLASAAHFVSKNRIVRFLPALFISDGPILILIGLLLFAKLVFQDAGSTTTTAPTAAPPTTTTIDLGYSLVLMVIACILGFLASTVFSFLTSVGIRSAAPSTNRKKEFPSSEMF